MGRIPAQDPGEVAAAAAAAATADALAKVKAAQQEKEAGTVTVDVAPATGCVEGPWVEYPRRTRAKLRLPRRRRPPQMLWPR
mmetsp:Transcript_74736/g.123418  ORF Transcript_74736/g.123418 Transcript_74736/m.123418 type:complete len:82 (-) Transcript_74736:48-293(-)